MRALAKLSRPTSAPFLIVLAISVVILMILYRKTAFTYSGEAMGGNGSYVTLVHILTAL